jgi:hypothetical protein
MTLQTGTYTTVYRNWAWLVVFRSAIGDYCVKQYVTRAVNGPHERTDAKRLAEQHAENLNNSRN